MTRTNSYQRIHKLILVCASSLFLVQNAWSQLPIALQDWNQLTTYSELTKIVHELDADLQAKHQLTSYAELSQIVQDLDTDPRE